MDPYKKFIWISKQTSCFKLPPQPDFDSKDGLAHHNIMCII